MQRVIPLTDQQIRDGEQRLRGAMQPVHICKACAVVNFGVNASWDGGEHEDQQKVKPAQRELWGFAAALEKIQECQVREQTDRKK